MINNISNDIEKKKIFSLVKQYEVVSFDVFDTLVLRNVVDPKDLFKAVEVEYENRHSKKLDYDFYEKRHECEMQARVCRAHQEDIVFDDIYDALLKYYSEDVCEKLKEIELSLEKEFIVLNPFMKDVYDYAIKSNKRVYFVSDMYLPQSFLNEILSELGYGFYEHFYVSCEYMKTKHHGSLFKLIKEKENIDDGVWLHIGDNYNSDVYMAEVNGVVGYHYIKVSEREGVYENLELEDSIVTAIEINKVHTNFNDYWFDFGFGAVARLYYFIAKWLVENAKDEVDNIYFLARDGYIIKKIVDDYFSNELGSVKTHYLYTSRRAFQFAECAEGDIEELAFILTRFNPQFDQKITVREILSNLNVEQSEFESSLKEYDLELDTLLSINDGSLTRAQKFIKNNSGEILKILNQEKEALLKYLEQEGLFENKRNAIFDVGWRGSIQKSMQSLLGSKLMGFYFGTNQFVHNDVAKHSKGFVIDKGLPNEMSEFISHYLMIFEMLFTAPHGSLQYFKEEEEGEITPVLSDVENGGVFYNAISSLQKGAVEGVGEIKKYSRFFGVDNTVFSIKKIKNKLASKRFVDLYHFSSLSNSVGFGECSDLKKYVDIYEMSCYVKKEGELKTRASYNLWPGAYLVRDEMGRLFTCDEIDAITRSDVIRPESFVPMSVEKLFFKKVYEYYKTRGLKAFLKRSVVSAKFIYSSIR